MSQLNNVQRRLAEGLAGWLLFEFHCQRGDLFSERYLAAPIGQILAGIHGIRIEAEVNHPVLANDDISGRRPQVDFAVREDGAWKAVIESKWTGRSDLSLDELIWDLVRLELLAYELDVECYFVLAGFRKKLAPLLALTHFGSQNQTPTENGGQITTKHKSTISLCLSRLPADIQGALGKRESKYPHVKFPTKIICDFPHSYPATGSNLTFQVFVWRVRAKSKAPRQSIVKTEKSAQGESAQANL